MFNKITQFIWSFNNNQPIKEKDPRPIILVLIGLYDGRGDWIHGLEIAKYVKNKFGDKYRIFGFPFYMEFYNNEANAIAEINEFIHNLKSEIPIDHDKYSEFKLKANAYFDYLFPASDYYESIIFKDFIKERNEIFCILKISCMNTCYALTEEDVNLYGLNCPIIYLSEYAFSNLYLPDFPEEARNTLEYNLRDFNWEDNLQNVLFMGFNQHSIGIRIYNLLEEENYWQQLQEHNSTLFNKLLMHNNYDYNQYYENRKLLPGDLRTIESILRFIEINLIRYGSKCDFYLPKKDVETILFHSPSSLFDRFKEILNKYGISKCNYIIPNSALSSKLSLNSNNYVSCEDNILGENEIRIFSGFDLSDNLYKGLYLYNREAGAGISGDDGWSLAISGGNLPFINNGEWQGNVVDSIKELAVRLKLNILKEYFECLEYTYDDSYDLKRFFELKKLISEQKELLATQYATLVKHIKKDMNIYDKLGEKILAIEEQQKQYNSVNVMKKK